MSVRIAPYRKREEDSILFATASYDNTIRLWNPHSGLTKRILQHPESQVNAMAFSPDKTTLAAAGFESVRFFDLETNHSWLHFSRFANMAKNITVVGYQRKQRWLYTGGEDEFCRVWDIRRGYADATCALFYKTKGQVTAVALNPVDENQVFIGDSVGCVYMWDLRKNQDVVKRYQTEPLGSVRSIAVDGQGSCFAALMSSGRFYRWGLKANSEEATSEKTKVESHKKYGLKCAFSPDNTLFLTSGADEVINIFKTVDFSLFRTLTTDGIKWIWDCAFSSDSQYVLSGSSDGLGRLWCIDSGKVKREYRGHTMTISCIAFRDDSVPSKS